jgi:hypothetical protein
MPSAAPVPAPADRSIADLHPSTNGDAHAK